MRYETIFCIDGSGEKNLIKAEAKRPIYRIDVKKGKITRSVLGNGESNLDFFARQIKDNAVAKPMLIAADCPIGLPAQPCDVYQSLKAETFLEWLELTKQRLDTDQQEWRKGLISEGYRKCLKPFVEKPRIDKGKTKYQVYTRRLCDKKSNGESVYYLLGNKQVGKAALQFWFEVLQPLRERFQNRLAVWPFESLENGDVVVAECYPALYVESVYGSKISKSTSNQVVRALSCLRNGHGKAMKCEIEMQTWMHAASSSDEFDMFTTAYYISQEMEKGRENILSYPKKNLECETVEGWMLGLRP